MAIDKAGDPYNGPGFSPYVVQSTDIASSVYMKWSLKIDQRFKDMLEAAYDAGYARAHYAHTGEKSHGDDLPLTFEEWLAKMLEENSGD